MKRLAMWYLRRKGYAILDNDALISAMARLVALEASIAKSGHLSTASGRKPKVVRKLDREVGAIGGLMEHAQRAA